MSDFLWAAARGFFEALDRTITAFLLGFGFAAGVLLAAEMLGLIP